MTNILDQIQDIADIVEYLKVNWWWILITLVVGITLVSMFIKWILSRIVLLLLKTVLYIIMIPVRLMVRYPWLIVVILFVVLIIVL